MKLCWYGQKLALGFSCETWCASPAYSGALPAPHVASSEMLIQQTCHNVPMLGHDRNDTDTIGADQTKGVPQGNDSKYAPPRWLRSLTARIKERRVLEPIDYNWIVRIQKLMMIKAQHLLQVWSSYNAVNELYNCPAPPDQSVNHARTRFSRERGCFLNEKREFAKYKKTGNFFRNESTKFCKWVTFYVYLFPFGFSFVICYAYMYMRFNYTLEVLKNTPYIENYLQFDTVILTFTKRVLYLI